MFGESVRIGPGRTFHSIRTQFSRITDIQDAEDCYFTNEETQACVEEAHKHGIRLGAHAQARDYIRQCLDHGVEVIYSCFLY